MRRGALLFLLLFWASFAFAQTPSTGIPLYATTFAGQSDSINLQNLNVVSSIPVVQVPGRGAALSFSIVYNSLLWQNVGGAWTSVTDNAGSPTWGWTLTPAGGVSGSASSQVEFVFCNSIPPQKASHYFGFVYTEPNGTRHTFSSIDYYNVATQCGFPTGPKTGYADDNSGFYTDASFGFFPRVFNPSGVQLTGGGSGVNEDTNGNYVTPATVNSSETDWKDTLGRTALKYITSTSTNQYQYQDNTGTYQTITLKLQNFNIKTNFACSGIVEYTGTASLPTEIDLPNGQKYLITYEGTPNFSGYYTGRIKRMTLSTGGYYEYDYPTSAGDGIVCADATVNSLTRVVNDGTNTSTWTFSRAPSGSNWVTTATAPQMPYDSAANNSVYTFNSSGQQISAKIYQGAVNSQNLKRTVNTTWTNGAPATKITILEDGQTQSEVETSYDSAANLLTIKEHDWGNGAPGPVLRTTAYSYLSSSPYTAKNILNRQTIKTIADSTGTIKYREVTTYDSTTLGPCPTGVTQHDDTNYGCSNTTRGNPTSVTVYTDPVTPSGPITKNSYFDVFGNLLQADLDCCQSKKWSYSSTTQYAYPDSDTCGASGGPQLTTSYTYNAYTGLLITTTDPNNLATTNSYDIMKRLTAVTRPDNSQITYAYNDTAITMATTTPIDATHSRVETTSYDGLNRTIKRTLSDASSNVYSIVQTQYDPVGRVYKVSNPFTGTAQYWTTTQFDALGRVTKKTLQDNSQSTYSYSAATMTFTDPAGKQRKLQFDPMMRQVYLFEPDVTNNNSLSVQTSYSYSVLDKLATVTQGVQSRTYNYDGAGRLTSETTPEAGTVSYVYNSFGLLTQKTDARGVVKTNSYDTLNRLTQSSYNVGTTGVPATPTVTYTYGTSAAQLNNGKLITLTDGPGSEAYIYDNLGRTTQLQKVINSRTYTTSYQYNLAGSVTSLTYPSGRVVQPAYDAIGRLLSTASGTTTYASNLTYNVNSQPIGFTYGNGVVASESYSVDRLQTQSLSYTVGSATLFSLTYGYTQNGGNNGEITSITDNVDSGRTINYAYDALHRLTSAVTNGSANYPQWGLTWSYDRYGNRLSQSATSDAPPTNSLSFANPGGAQTNRPDGMCFDANGNLTAESGTCPPSAPTYTWDAENRLVNYNGPTASYTYDGNGLRVAKSAGGTTTVYLFSNGQVLAEYDNGALPSSPSREYIYLSGALLAKVESSAVIYYHRDHLSNRVLTDSNGNILGQRGHYPFGDTWYESGTTTKFKFATYERDSESTNDYARARSYANRFGRFASTDFVEPAKGQNAQGLNRYPYSSNDPVNLSDPGGQRTTPGPFVEPFLEGPTDLPPGNCYIAGDFAQIGIYVPICFPDDGSGGGETIGGGGGGASLGPVLCECNWVAGLIRRTSCHYLCICSDGTPDYFGFYCPGTSPDAKKLCPPFVIIRTPPPKAIYPTPLCR